MKKQFENPRPTNPMLPPDWCIPDGEARSMPDGRLYLYGSHDVSDDDYCSRDYAVFSTEDFSRWEVNYPSFSCDEIPWLGTTGLKTALDRVNCFDDLPILFRKMMPKEARKMPIGALLETIRSNLPALDPEKVMLYAPDVIEKDGRYYLFFCLSDSSEGVAVSDHPDGPFTDPKAFDTVGIDPSIFIDDDGKAYLYWDQFSSRGVQLTENLDAFVPGTETVGLVTEEEHHFHEGSSIRKRGDTYYYVFADTSREGRPTCLGYATSKSPLGPFTYQGVIIDNAGCDPETWNNHGCIEEYNGQWYVFYHRSSRGTRYNRRACCEKIRFDENGLIPEVKMTSQGAGEPFARGEKIPAYTACEVKGGAYIDGSILMMKDGSEAAFRYIAKDDQPLHLTVGGEGQASVTLYCNEHELGSSILQDGKAEFTVPPIKSDWELRIRLRSEKEVKLFGICIA